MIPSKRYKITVFGTKGIEKVKTFNTLHEINYLTKKYEGYDYEITNTHKSVKLESGTIDENCGSSVS